MSVIQRERERKRESERERDRLDGNSKPCSSTRLLLCCTQIVNTQMLMSQQRKKKFNNFHKLTCKSQYVIYLMECILCEI